MIDIYAIILIVTIMISTVSNLVGSKIIYGFTQFIIVIIVLLVMQIILTDVYQQRQDTVKYRQELEDSGKYYPIVEVKVVGDRYSYLLDLVDREVSVHALIENIIYEGGIEVLGKQELKVLKNEKISVREIVN